MSLVLDRQRTLSHDPFGSFEWEKASLLSAFRGIEVCSWRLSAKKRPPLYSEYSHPRQYIDRYLDQSCRYPSEPVLLAIHIGIFSLLYADGFSLAVLLGVFAEPFVW